MIKHVHAALDVAPDQDSEDEQLAKLMVIIFNKFDC